MNPTLRKWAPFAVIVVLVILVDQWSKEWVLANMELGETILIAPALHPFFQFTRSFNTGAAFGIFPDAGVAFLVIAVVITILILYFYVRSPVDALLMHIALSLVVGGAAGNLIDRLQHGLVVDFIHYRIPGGFSNVSNLADHAIVFGVILLFIDNIRRERAIKRSAVASSDSSGTPSAGDPVGEHPTPADSTDDGSTSA